MAQLLFLHLNIKLILSTNLVCVYEEATFIKVSLEKTQTAFFHLLFYSEMPTWPIKEIPTAGFYRQLPFSSAHSDFRPRPAANPQHFFLISMCLGRQNFHWRQSGSGGALVQVLDALHDWRAKIWESWLECQSSWCPFLVIQDYHPHWPILYFSNINSQHSSTAGGIKWPF